MTDPIKNNVVSITSARTGKKASKPSRFDNLEAGIPKPVNSYVITVTATTESGTASKVTYSEDASDPFEAVETSAHKWRSTYALTSKTLRLRDPAEVVTISVEVRLDTSPS